MRLTIQQCEGLGDWYVIERAEHDGRSWFEQTAPNCHSLRLSSRMGNADVEGSGAEMLAIADGITRRERTSFRRCDVRFDGDRVYFSSPRNSHGDIEPCTLAEADELAALIRSSVTAPSPESRP